MIFDLMIIENDPIKRYVIKFKYKTKGRSGLKVFKVHDYKSSNQAAQNLGRFDCWSDIERLEYEEEKGYLTEGYFVFITNDSAYWQAEGESLSMQNGSLSMKSGPHLHEIKKLPDDASANSWGNRRIDHNLRFPKGEKGIQIKGDYDFEYQNFGNAGFKSLLVEIK